jgi:hypothetical protein
MVNAFSVLKFRLFYNLRHNIYVVKVLEEISLLTFKKLDIVTCGLLIWLLFSSSGDVFSLK